MTDTPRHIKDLQLKLWLSKTPGERLYQFLIDNDAMLNGLREAKRNLGIPLGDLDFVSEYLKKRQKQDDCGDAIYSEDERSVATKMP